MAAIDTALKVIWGLVFGAVLLFAAVFFAGVAWFRYGPGTGWRGPASVTRAMSAGEMVVGYDVPESSDVVHVRVKIRASQPVNVGFVPAGEKNDLLKNWATAGALLRSMPYECMQQNVLDATVDCAVVPGRGPRAMILWDARDPSTASVLGSGVAAYFGAKQPLQDLMSSNTVSIDFKACSRGCGD